MAATAFEYGLLIGEVLAGVLGVIERNLPRSATTDLLRKLRMTMREGMEFTLMAGLALLVGEFLQIEAGSVVFLVARGTRQLLFGRVLSPSRPSEQPRQDAVGVVCPLAMCLGFRLQHLSRQVVRRSGQFRLDLLVVALHTEFCLRGAAVLRACQDVGDPLERRLIAGGMTFRTPILAAISLQDLGMGIGEWPRREELSPDARMQSQREQPDRDGDTGDHKPSPPLPQTQSGTTWIAVL